MVNPINRVLAVDYGLKRIGFAVGNDKEKIAFPGEVIKNSGFELVYSYIKNFVIKWEISILLVGLPLNMESNVDSKISIKVKDFFALIDDKAKKEDNEWLQNLKIIFFDERLSTFEADKKILESGTNYKFDKSNQDAIAAQVILQRFFDNQSN